jgi:hypothetical protein
MTNPTSNFGWQMPTPTDLVTDLPADFEVFGQAVDTSMADLKGGTTGQILSKASNTNMDFTWITNDVGDITAVNVTSPITGGGSSGAVTIGINAATTSVVGAVQLSDSTSTTSSVLASTPTATKSAYDLADAAIPKSTVTTAGDIIYRNATVPTRLGIGTAGQVLTVNTGATAPEWKTPTTSSGALVFIDRQTFSAVSSFSFTSKFSSTYDNYKIVLRIDSVVTAANIQMRLRSASTDNTSSNYRSGRLYQVGSTVAGAGGTATATSFDLITDYNAQNSYLSMDLYAPYLTQYTGYTAQASYFYSAFGQHNQVDAGQMSVTTSYDGLTFLPNAGTMTGEVYLYGYSRS